MEKLKLDLSEIGNIEFMKSGVVFTLLLTGKGLSNGNTFNNINRLVVDRVGLKYPLIEAMKNADTFYLIVLKQRKTQPET